ncbi:protein (some members containing a von Willebrand factor type A (vWA) domain), partial [human gut metagenome]
MPIPALVVLLNAADEWGGGQITLRCAAMLGGKESAEQRITLNAGKSGVWSIAVRGITLRDHLGVFTAACPAAVQSQSICVLPAAAAGKAKAETAPDEDGDEADTRAALGGSYELREYRDGDTLKQVHWKLSAKLDRLMVREPLTALRAALTPGGDLDGAEEWGGFSPTGGEAPQKPAQAQKRTYCPEPARRCRPRQWAEVCGPCAGEHPAPRSAPRVWLAADAALLLALTFGLLLVLSTGFGIAVPL